MRYTILFIGILITLTCHSQKKSKSKKRIDKALVGTWRGFESDQESEGVEKYWMQHRSEDGTFMLLMISMSKYEEPEMMTIKGKWWVENELFHETYDYSGMTDVYTYKVVDGAIVVFRAHKMSQVGAEDYQFVEEKL